MTMISCHECKREVSTEAKTCPACGAKVARPKEPAGKLWPLLGVFAVIGVVVASQNRLESTAQAAAAEAAQTPEQRASVKAATAKRDASLQSAVAGVVALKRAMKDPQAFELASVTVADGGAACYEYRAKNSFGAVMPGSAVLTSAGKMLVEEKNGNSFVAAWNKVCTAAGGLDITEIVRRMGVV